MINLIQYSKKTCIKLNMSYNIGNYLNKKMINKINSYF